MIDRDMYKRIKKMNREQLNQFLKSLYLDTMKEGAEISLEFDHAHFLSETLKATKGVGDIVYERAMKNGREIYKNMKLKENANE